MLSRSCRRTNIDQLDYQDIPSLQNFPQAQPLCPPHHSLPPTCNPTTSPPLPFNHLSHFHLDLTSGRKIFFPLSRCHWNRVSYLLFIGVLAAFSLIDLTFSPHLASLRRCDILSLLTRFLVVLYCVFHCPLLQ